MRVVVQRVFEARVEVEGSVVGRVDTGLCAFVGADRADGRDDIQYAADRVAHLRIFPDAEGRMSLDVKETGGGILAISQFTLFGDTRKGRRPSFNQAKRPPEAEDDFEAFVTRLRSHHGLVVGTGRFGAKMRVVVDNDGPVSILIDSKKQF